MSDTLIRLAGLFECESAAGNRYFTGLLNGGVKLVMLKNNYKTADNEPDWNLYLTERQREGAGSGSKVSAEVQPEVGKSRESERFGSKQKRKPRRRRSARSPPAPSAPHEDDPNDDIADLLEAG